MSGEPGDPMTYEITKITTPFILHITVNCYLVRLAEGFILIDTAKAGQRRVIESELARLGCKPGDLKLIVLTHGDFDHCGNAAYLRKKYDTKIAMHADDLGMVEHGDMFWNRKQPNVMVKALMRLMFRLRPEDRFTPDFMLTEGDRLLEFGFDAEVIELPGHSKGSIGLLTHNYDLFCGDLLANTSQPALWTIIDDQVAADASLSKLMSRPIKRVYPGHGEPFEMSTLVQSRKQPVAPPIFSGGQTA